MAYLWTADLETGNATIDAQHKELINAINSLLAACSTGNGRSEIEKTAKFLQDYTIKHFNDEEKMQIQSGYPDFSNHRKYHEGFKVVVADIVKQLREDGPTILLTGKVNSAIASWLITHIKREDVKVAAHIKAQ